VGVTAINASGRCVVSATHGDIYHYSYSGSRQCVLALLTTLVTTDQSLQRRSQEERNINLALVKLLSLYRRPWPNGHSDALSR